MTINLINGNAKHLPLASGSVQCCVTSPPYWGLRAYLGNDDPNKKHELGLEPVPDCLGWATGEPCGECYVCHMVAVFREVKRVLRSDGICFLNLGDSYAHSQPGRNRWDTMNNVSGGTVREGQHADYVLKGTPQGYKSKDLCGIPWRVAFALQADGWYLRSDIIWHKPNPMPESVTDRPTKAHEYIFLLSKSARYYYDAEAVKEPTIWADDPRAGSGRIAYDGKRNGKAGEGQEAFVSIDPSGRNRRTVWTVATAPYSGAHFATFPPKLIEPCILAGTSERGCCPACGAPWGRVVETALTAHDGATASAYPEGTTANRLALLRQAARERGEEYSSARKTLGWRPTCACPAHEPTPCLVLDPFNGSGTTGRVAVQHRRRYVGTELNPDYIELAHERTGRVQIEMAV